MKFEIVNQSKVGTGLVLEVIGWAFKTRRVEYITHSWDGEAETTEGDISVTINPLSANGDHFMVLIMDTETEGEEMKIELGKKYKCKVTGVIGTATARVNYLHRSPQTQLEWMRDDGGRSDCWLEDAGIEEVEK